MLNNIMSWLTTLDKQTFHKFVAESVEKALSVLGGRAKDAILVTFLNKYNLADQEEIADHPKEFENFLLGIFDHGASIIIRAIVTDMFKKLSMSETASDMDLEKAIQTLQKMIRPNDPKKDMKASN